MAICGQTSLSIKDNDYEVANQHMQAVARLVERGYRLTTLGETQWRYLVRQSLLSPIYETALQSNFYV